MVERRPWLDILAHLILLCGVALVAFPLYVTFVASTQTAQEVAAAPMSLLPGPHFVDNYARALAGDGVSRMLYVSLIMALVISLGKIRSEEHTSELQSLMRISYAVFCLKKKKMIKEHGHT